MIKIAFIITGLCTGGAEAMLLKLLQHIDRDRFLPSVVSLTTKGENGPRIEALGIPVQTLGMSPGVPSPSKFMRLVGLLQDARPDVVQTWMYHADLIGGLAARLTGIQTVSWGIRHSNLSPHQNKRATLLVVKLCALASGWLPHRILSCSERARSIHVDAGYLADKMVVIPNGFDLTRFQPDPVARDSVRSELGVPPETSLIGLIARDDPQKNHKGFIEAATIVHAALPQAHFVLAGTGINQDNTELKQLIEQFGLKAHCHLLGRRDDIPRLMASLDVLASSSTGEAFPNVLGEAMACGIPCVVTDVGDSAEIVGDTGRVVASGDMAGLATQLVTLLSIPPDERSRLGISARERVRERYEIGSVTRQYEHFYEMLLQSIK